LPAGNARPSVAASSPSRTLVVGRWCSPSLTFCGPYSVLMYPILFSVTDGRCSDSVPKMSKKSTWASSLIRGNVNAQSDHRLDAPYVGNRPHAGSRANPHPSGVEPLGLRSHGGRLRGPCSIQGSRFAGSRVFSVSLFLDPYRCLQCHSVGTQLGLWAAVHGLTIHAAAPELCKRLGLPVPWLPSERTPRTTI
jgi:hypothetical protein